MYDQVLMKNRGKGFNRLSSVYDLILKITSGNTILNSQTRLLNKLPELNRVLIVGGGTGSFLLELLKQKRINAVTYLDLSEGMILQTKKKLKKQMPEALAKIDFVCGTINTLAPDQVYDAVFTNYFLDLFEPAELTLVINKIHAHLLPGGSWYVTDFTYVDATLPAAQSFLYKSIHRLLYFFFGTFCGISAKRIPDLNAEMQKTGMKKTAECYSLKQLLWSCIYIRE